MSQPVEERVTELEVRLAFVESTVQTLDATVVAQDRLLADLRRDIERLRQELGSMTLGAQPDARDETPPHY